MEYLLSEAGGLDQRISTLVGRLLRPGGDHDHERDVLTARTYFTVAMIVLGVFTSIASAQSTQQERGIFMTAVAALFAALCALHWRTRGTPKGDAIQIACFILDLPLLTLAMGMTPQVAGLIVPVALFAVTNVGLRYGRALLFVSQGLALSSFGIVLAVSEYWHNNLQLALAAVVTMTLIPPQIAVIVARGERAREKLHRLAMYDQLTCLANRRLLMDQLPAYQARSTRHGSVVYVCYFDLDNFKAVNDTLGHDVGDALLSGIGKLLQTRVRKEDLLARMGGDEFVLVAEVQSNESSTDHVADKIIETVSEVSKRVCPGFCVGASVGIARYPDLGRDLSSDDLIGLADAAMYRAKQLGKNQISKATAFDAQTRISRHARPA